MCLKFSPGTLAKVTADRKASLGSERCQYKQKPSLLRKALFSFQSDFKTRTFPRYVRLKLSYAFKAYCQMSVTTQFLSRGWSHSFLIWCWSNILKVWRPSLFVNMRVILGSYKMLMLEDGCVGFSKQWKKCWPSCQRSWCEKDDCQSLSVHNRTQAAYFD